MWLNMLISLVNTRVDANRIYIYSKPDYMNIIEYIISFKLTNYIQESSSIHV